jgi:YD repeat-containing protein
VWTQETPASPETLEGSYTFHATGTLASVTTANGLTTAYGYDALNRLRRTTVGTVNAAGNAFTSVLRDYNYGVGAAGHRVWETELGGTRIDYGYDRLHRLNSETRTGWGRLSGAIGYEHDKVGNRTLRTSTVAGVVPVGLYQYNERDLLTAIDGRVRTYDTSGNTTTVAALVSELGSSDLCDAARQRED